MDDSESTFNVSNQMTVLDLKQNINEKLSVPIDRQRLLFQGWLLKDEELLSVYKIKENMVI